MGRFRVGQQWMSDAEPELGLGTVCGVEGRHVELEFPAADERRRYLASAAPLRRVRFRIGDRVADVERPDEPFAIEDVVEEDGLLRYRGGGRSILEGALAAAASPSLSRERLLSGRVDPPSLFDLRVAAIERWSSLRRSRSRGFQGARVALLPHQLGIAAEVASRQAPRVLLADEVGLGKTIEAGLVLHRLLQSGRAARVLVLVPPNLVHQWLVELLRRFNVWFRIFDEERCAAMEERLPDENPFLDEQLVLAGLDLFADERRRRQVAEAPWDALIVDEAHRLARDGDGESGRSVEYDLVADLAERARAVLLLTATPEQLGRGAHFDRLRLLDPARYTDRSGFEREAESYADVAGFVDRLLDGGPLATEDRGSRLLAEPSGLLLARFDAAAAGDPRARERLVDDLVDRHGPGRVVFRNTRAAIGGFPERRLHRVPLPWGGGPVDAPVVDAVDAPDPRVAWLRDLLRERADEKVLLICRTRAQVEAIAVALARLVNVPTAVFHEGLTLLQRDRNAAYFAEPDGARLLLCSEIGSEGRNFQFSHHLVLFDLPDDPELLEQRIGRLDRIGQSHDVEIHVPVLAGTSVEVRATWLHEGLDAFERSLRGAHEIYRRFGGSIAELAARFDRGESDRDALESLVGSSRQLRDEVAARLEVGRDRLLERSSFRSDRAEPLRAEIAACDEDTGLEELIIRLLEHHGVEVDEIAPRTYRLEHARSSDAAFPGLPADGLTATFSRERALAREDWAFLSWEHPLAQTAAEMLFGSEAGNAAFALLAEPEDPTLLLEACFVVECVAPTRLGVDRFLPPTPVRLALDQRLAPRSDSFAPGQLARAAPEALLGNREIGAVLLPRMLAAVEAAASPERERIAAAATQRMEDVLGRELERLELLRATGGRVEEGELALARDEMAELRTALGAARLRLDSLRLVWKGPRELLDAT